MQSVPLGGRAVRGRAETVQSPLVQPDAAAVRDSYRRYLERCNEHHVGALAEFVSEDVNGPGHGFDGYARDLREVIDALPDIHWELQQLIVDGDWLAARLLTSGTHTGWLRDVAPTGRRVTVQELVVYRWKGGEFVSCWGDLTAVLRDALLGPA